MNRLNAATLAGQMLLTAWACSAAAETYKIDAMHSMPSFTYKHLDLSMFRGRFDRITGVVTFDPKQRAGNTEVTVEVSSVSTGVPMLDQFLTSPKFFDAAKFPVITFRSRAFNFEGERLVSVTGDLTIHGVTKPVTLEILFLACHPHQLLKVPACGADARATIRRSEFGLGAFIPNDADEVMLDIPVEVLGEH
jgi:polyisoprenoid-binding protein YceI